MADKDIKQETVPPADDSPEEVKPKKKRGFFGRIFAALTDPFVSAYRRIILALSNTARRIWNAIKFVGSKLWFVLKRLLIASAVVGAIAGSIYLALYFKVLDLDDLNRSLMLWKWPVIGENFVEPPPLPEPEPEPEEKTKPEGEAGKDKKKPAVEDVRPKQAEEKAPSKQIKITKADIEKQMQEAAKAEKKRAAKLARLYENMKPQEAADIMNEMDDATVISVLQRMEESAAAKVLAKLDPVKAGRLSNIIFHGGSAVPKIGRLQ